jgi:hypothetical protein
MRPFERLDEGEKQIVRYQAKQFMKHARLFHAEVIPSIPTDEDDEDEIIPRAPATMEQQENGWGYNEREAKTPGHNGSRSSGERRTWKQKAPAKAIPPRGNDKKGNRGSWIDQAMKRAEASKKVGAAEIVAKKRPELKR